MRRGVEKLRAQNVLSFDGLLKVALAEAEPGRAILVGLSPSSTKRWHGQTEGFRASEAELHRGRGEILLKCDPANPAPVEVAFQTAIAVAKQQGTRSFDLRAALSLAKLYQSTAAPRKRTPSSHPRSKGFRRRRKCRRSLRRRRCWWLSRPARCGTDKHRYGLAFVLF